MSIEPERRAELLRGKLLAIVESAGYEIADSDDKNQTHDSALLTKDNCWLLVNDETPQSALGKGILLLSRHPHLELCLIFEDAISAGVAARQAAGLNIRCKVMLLHNQTLTQVDPSSFPKPFEIIPISEEFLSVCEAAGVSVICENGTWRGEILGLEVVRLEGENIQIGVGRFDREAGELLNYERSLFDQLVSASNQIRSQRNAEAGSHPLATLARERWLRHSLLEDPSVVGLKDVEPIDSVHERENLRDPFPAAAIGKDEDQKKVLVVCSVGVDIALVPLTAELSQIHLPDRIVIVLPPKDLLPVIHTISEFLKVPSSLIGIEGEWACPTGSE
ncbi:MAG: Uncharacterised protein [Acidimicrobiales bacterium AG-410-I20]|nr:MAG: Uncharacterised protein [Acidimicrobiales bacterium AG-410-I20]